MSFSYFQIKLDSLHEGTRYYSAAKSSEQAEYLTAKLIRMRAKHARGWESVGEILIHLMKGERTGSPLDGKLFQPSMSKIKEAIELYNKMIPASYSHLIIHTESPKS